jgi:hypothetical protein
MNVLIEDNGEYFVLFLTFQWYQCIFKSLCVRPNVY